VIVVTHDLTDLLSLAERVVVLADGHIAADGPPEIVRDRLSALGVREPPSIES
jgi:ABC-type sulfate/molybdate transport systems ATPase subunit